jgi:hypothetical protein
MSRLRWIDRMTKPASGAGASPCFYSARPAANLDLRERG